MTDDVIVRASRLDATTIGIEVYILDTDDTCDYYPSVHRDSIDVAAVEAQIRAHYAEKVN